MPIDPVKKVPANEAASLPNDEETIAGQLVEEGADVAEEEIREAASSLFADSIVNDPDTDEVPVDIDLSEPGEDGAAPELTAMHEFGAPVPEGPLPEPGHQPRIPDER